MNSYVVPFAAGLPLSLAGGKGAGLGELSEIEGISVPEGFVVTTKAYEKMVGGFIDGLLDELTRCAVGRIGGIGAEMRRIIEGLPSSQLGPL